ncbi:hypothetical protein ACVXG7_22275 [Enterobacter hormaechei]
MVGCLLMQRMVGARFRRHPPCLLFYFSASAGCAVFWGPRWHVSGCLDLEALKALDIIVTCQGGDYTNEIYPSS